MSTHSSELATAVALLEAGQARKALQALASYLAKHPDDSLAHARVAQAHVELGEWAAALNAAELAISLDPRSEHAFRLIAVAHANLGNRSGAVVAAETAQSLDPNNWATHYTRAHIDALVSRYSHAGREAVDVMIRLAPDLADAQALAANHLLIGALDASDRDQARSHLAAALAIDPQHAYALHLLAELEVRSFGRKAKGFAPVMDAVAADPTQLFNRRALLTTINKNLRLLGWIYCFLLLCVGLATANIVAYRSSAVIVAAVCALLSVAWFALIRRNLRERAWGLVRTVWRASAVVAARLIVLAASLVFLLISPIIPVLISAIAALVLLALVLASGVAAKVDQYLR